MGDRVWQKDISKGDRIKQMLLNPIRANEPATAKFNILDRLDGTPYRVKGSTTETPQQKVAREIIMLAADISETMLRFGAGAREVETTLIAVAGAFGIKEDIDIDINYQAVNINYAPAGDIPYTVLRVTRSWSDNYMGLIQIHELVADIIEHKVSVTESRDRVRFINKSPKPYARWFVQAAHGVFFFFVVLTLGGNFFAAIVGFFISIFVGQLIRLMGKYRLPELYSVAISSSVITFLAGLSAHANLHVAPALIVASGIMALLPAMGLVSAIRDSITGYPVTASARMLIVVLLFTGIVSGISVGIVLIDQVGLDPIDITQTFDGPAYPIHVLLVGITATCYAVTMQTARRTLIPVAFTAMAGYTTFYLLTQLEIGPRLAPAMAAVVIGFLADIIASRVNVPSIVIFLPALINLLPGMMILRATYNITTGVTSSVGGIADLGSAILIAVGLAAGVVFGDYLGQPWQKTIAEQTGKSKPTTGKNPQVKDDSSDQGLPQKKTPPLITSEIPVVKK